MPFGSSGRLLSKKKKNGAATKAKGVRTLFHSGRKMNSFHQIFFIEFETSILFLFMDEKKSLLKFDQVTFLSSFCAAMPSKICCVKFLKNKFCLNYAYTTNRAWAWYSTIRIKLITAYFPPRQISVVLKVYQLPAT